MKSVTSYLKAMQGHSGERTGMYKKMVIVQGHNGYLEGQSE